MIWKGQGVVASFVQATFAVAALSRSEGGQGWSGEQALHRLRSVVHKGQARRVPLSRLQVMTKNDSRIRGEGGEDDDCTTERQHHDPNR